MSNELRPTTGGSYIRNPETGELMRAEETPAEPPAAEPAADSPPAKTNRKTKTPEGS